MKRSLLLSLLLTILFVANVHGSSTNNDSNAPRLADRIKFGLGLGRGALEASPFVLNLASQGVQKHYNFLDIFGEYMSSSELGIRLSIQPTWYQEQVRSVNTSLFCFKIAPTLRVYAGTNKRLCFFFGPQICLLSGAKIKTGDRNEEKVINLLERKDFEEEYSSDQKLCKVATTVKVGWDYECENGLIIGGFLNTTLFTNGKNDVKDVSIFPKSEHELFYLGYNFAKLLN